MFNIGDKIKINDSLCPDDKRTQAKFQFGSLNYLALMLDWEFEIIKLFKDDYHGEMAECSVVNVENIKSNIVVKIADMVLAGKSKIKIDFEILSKVNKFQSEIDSLVNQDKALVEVRSELKRTGMKITERVLLDNWNEIKSIRAKLNKLTKTASEPTLFRVKHELGIFDFDCKEEDIPKKLRAIIRQRRSDSKVIVPKTKKVSTNLSYDTVGGVLTKAGEFSRLNEKFALNIIKEHKKPTTTDNYVGIEIEMLSSKSIEDMNKEFIKARLHRFVNLGTDASIQSEVSGQNTMELRVCLPESLLESHLKLITDVLRRNDCYANRSCGMHVHLDMRNRDAELAYKNFFKVQDLMLATQPISRRSNKYCKPNTKESLAITEFSDGDRYQAINTQSYFKNDMRTIEIRLHEGATKYRDILNWVKFLVGVASLKTVIPTKVETASQLRQLDIMPSNIVDHIEERIEEYSA